MLHKTSFLLVFAFSFASSFLIHEVNAQTIYPDTLWVPVIFYDYWVDNNGTNPDFEIAPAGLVPGMVYDTLDNQKKPVPTPIACPTPPTAAPCACHLSEWFRVSGTGGSDNSCIFACDSVTNPKIKRWYWTTSTGGPLPPNPLGTGGFVGPNYYQTYNMRNIIFYDSIPFRHLGNGIYEINNGAFFPLDGRGFGNQPSGQNHNFGMAMELHTTFSYKKGLNFTFAGDDDCWVYINGKKVVDLGGRHNTLSDSISLDTMSGFTDGKTYNLDLFKTEKHTTGNVIRITSNIIAPKPTTLIVPIVPTVISPSNDTVITLPVVSFKWHSVPTASTYRVQISTKPDFSTLVKDTAGLKDTVINLSGLADSTKYYWCVNANNAAGTSGWSVNSIFETFMLILPCQVTLISPSDTAKIQADSALLVWSMGSPLVTRYYIQIATDSAMTFAFQDSTILDTTKLLKPLSSGQSYWWQVRAYNAAGWGAFSQKRKFTYVTTSAFPKKIEPRTFSCNGSSNGFQYTLPVQCQVSLKLFDVRGRMVATLVDRNQNPGTYSLFLPTQNWSKGTYLQVFKAGSFVKMERFVMVR